MKKSVIIIVLFLLPCILALTDDLKIEWHYGEDNWVNFGKDIWKAQTFKIGTSSNNINNINYTIDNIRIKIWRNSDIGEVIVSVKKVNKDDKPTGEDLSTGSVDLKKVTTTYGIDGGELHEIKMTPYKLERSETYAIVVRVKNNNYESALSWKGSTDDLYVGGTAYSSSDSGEKWNTENLYDFTFEILTEGSDRDIDGIEDMKDNCINIKNKDQKDTDLDGIGDMCDNCPFIYNPDQTDINKNDIGNACEITDKNVLVINNLTTKTENLNSVMINLSKKIESLEKKVNNLNTELTSLKNKQNDQEKKINALQKSFNDFKKLVDNFHEKFKNYFRHLTDTHRKQIVCAYMKDNNLGSYEDLGLKCELKKSRCSCKKV